MNPLVGIYVSDEESEMGGIVIYQAYADGKRIRQDYPLGSVEMYEYNGIPVIN